MMILALEFSADQRSVACVRGNVVLAEAEETGGRATDAIGLIERTLKLAGVKPEEIGGMAVGLGPGSYTGIRTALAVAEGWHLVRPVQFLGFSSVAVLAAQAQAEGVFGEVHLVVDAQRGEVYHSRWRISEAAVTELDSLKIIPASELAGLWAEGDVVAGQEAIRWCATGKGIFTRAAILGTMAVRKPQMGLAPLEPIYLRETSFVKAAPSRTY